MVGVSEVLNSPSLILILQVLIDLLVVLHLLSASRIDFVNGRWLEALEVVWHIAVLAELRCGGHWILSHEVGHIGAGDFLLVHILLIISPGLFTVSFLLSEHLVVRLQILELLILFVGHLVFEQTTHSSDGFRLLCVHGLLVLERVADAFLFRDLLMNPLLLDLVVQIHSVSVVY